MTTEMSLFDFITIANISPFGEEKVSTKSNIQ